MNNQWVAYIIALCVLLGAWGIGVRAIAASETELHPLTEQKRFIVYYGDTHEPQEFMPYDVIVFDRENHPDLSTLRGKGKILLGYISGGEGEQRRSDYDSHQKVHLLEKETNPNWDDNRIVDIRSPAWTAYIIEQLIPDMLHQGFDGIFIDTLDSIEHLESTKPADYKGMVEGAITMIKMIRLHYPDIKIMVNRGYQIVPAVLGEIDYVLGEGTLVKYDFESKKTELFPTEIFQEYVLRAAEWRKKAPHLQVMTLDYWDMDDKEGVEHIYNLHRANGFIPYVTTIDLENVHH
jgi:polysaccharide biosynthesis protein PelA